MALGLELERLNGLAVVTLDDPERPVNTLGEAALAAFEEVVNQLEAHLPSKGVLLVSGKPKSFVAGADLLEFQRMDSAEAVTDLLRRGQAMLGRWQRLPCVSVAAIPGPALGGGLELALGCTWRVAADDPATSLGLPETQLGLLPAMAGTWHLPRLVGLERGVGMILTGRRLNAAQALRAGLVDEVVAPGELRSAAERLLERGPRRLSISFRDRLLGGNPLGRRLFFGAARKRTLARTRGRYPAPLRALEAIEAGYAKGRAAGLESEARGIGELLVTDVSRRLIELFLATRELAAVGEAPEAASEPAGGRPAADSAGAEPGGAESGGSEAADTEAADSGPGGPGWGGPGTLGVLGAGFMGSGVAAAAARAGYRVRLMDSSPESLERGVAFCTKRFASLARRGKLKPEEARAAADRIVAGGTLDGLEEADLVVEAVVEDAEVKRALLAELEPRLGADAILGSNTSTIPIARLAEALERPERLVGIHFFSPVHRMPLVEVIRHPGSSDEAARRAAALAVRLGKTPIVVADGPGFYTSRILSPYLAQGAAMLLEGAGIADVDAAARDAGFPVGPLELLDEVGIDVAAKAAGTMAAAFPDRMPSPEGFRRLVEEGRLGRKSGRGFYDYSGKTKRPDPEVLKLLDGERAARRLDPPKSGEARAGERAAGRLDRREAGERVMLAMAAEAVRCLEDGILEQPRDGDVGAVLGLGFPPFTGGPFRYLDALGAPAALARLEELAAAHGAVFSVPARLRQDRSPFYP